MPTPDPPSNAGPELRWHPLLREWVGIAAHRQNRPQMPADWCPFCPGSGRVPDDYDVYLFPNDFPAFSPDAAPFSPETGLFRSTGAQGACDVVLYSPNHNLPPSELTVEQWEKVIDLWTRRTGELMARPEVQFVQVFENTGEAIGVTMPHPHGQIYGFPFIPPLVARELESASAHYREHGECLYCDILRGEIANNREIVASNHTWTAFLPYFGRFPTELQIYPKRHVTDLKGLTNQEKTGLAAILSLNRRKYNNLYGSPMPLMMMVRQAPKGEHSYFHTHIEFLPIRRSKTKLKYLAAVESGTGTFLNDTRPEEQAAVLRDTPPHF